MKKLLMASLLPVMISLSSCGDKLVERVELIPGPQGPAGEKGDQGDRGSDGSNGQSCTVQTVVPSVEAPAGGALILCGDSSVLLLNGVDGEDGADAPQTPYSIVEVIDPCGDASGIYDEIIIRLGTDELVASFSDNANGKNTRLSLLVPGTYQTTDGSNCVFTVSGDLEVTW